MTLDSFLRADGQLPFRLGRDSTPLLGPNLSRDPIENRGCYSMEANNNFDLNPF